MTSTLFTPVLSIETANTAGYEIYCYVMNASSSAQTGTLAIINLDGTVLSSASYNNTPAGGGTGIQVQKVSTATKFTLVYGKITVNGAANLIRANLALVDSKGNTLVSLDAQ